MDTRSHSDAKIMIVDDMPENLRFLEAVLRKQGYTVFAFTNGTAALKAVEKCMPDLFLLDINMPVMNGLDLCTHIKRNEIFTSTPVLFISGQAEIQAKMQAFKVGGADYITKPFQIEEILARVETHLHNRMLQKQVEEYNSALEEKVAEQVREISDSQVAAIVALAKLAESRDDNTGKHIERVQSFCRILARHAASNPQKGYHFDALFTENIYYASALHDLGKVGIPDAILLKPGKLTEAEYDIMKKHSVIGSQSLEKGRLQYSRNTFLNMGILVARHHHERWDGAGYPDNLAEDTIPLPARIMSIADVYDALRSERPYKQAFTHEKSRDIILEGRGTQFDPFLADVFVQASDDFDVQWNMLSEDRTPATNAH